MKHLINPKNIRTVLFDFDGVLMRSIEDHHRSWNEVFRQYDTEIGWEEFSTLEGQSLYTIAEQLCRHHGIDVSQSEKIGRAKNDLYLKTATLKLYDGAVHLLDTLKRRKLQIGLVTGAHRDRFEISVDHHFLSYFDAIITADDVTQTKPDPEPYLKAVAFIGTPANECVVVENAPLGIESAKRAGIPVIALTTTLSEKYLEDADLIVNSLSDVGDLFKEIRIEDEPST